MSTILKVPPGFDDAQEDGRISFVQEFWDRIAHDPGRVPVPMEHQRILEERLEEYRANPNAGRPWNEARDQVPTKLRRA